MRIKVCEACGAKYNLDTVNYCPLCANREIYGGEQKEERVKRKFEAQRFDRKYGKLKFYLVCYYFKKKTSVNSISRLLNLSRRAVEYVINLQK